MVETFCTEDEDTSGNDTRDTSALVLLRTVMIKTPREVCVHVFSPVSEYLK